MSPHEVISRIVSDAQRAVDDLGGTTFAHLLDYVFRLQQTWYSAVRDTSSVVETMAEMELPKLCRDHGVYVRFGRVYDSDGNWVQDGPVAEAVDRYNRVDANVTSWVGEQRAVTFGELRRGEKFKVPRDGERVYTKSNRDEYAVIDHHVYSFLPETEVIRVS